MKEKLLEQIEFAQRKLLEERGTLIWIGYVQGLRFALGLLDTSTGNSVNLSKYSDLEKEHG